MRKTKLLRISQKQYEVLKDQAEQMGISLHEYILLKLFPIEVNFEEIHFDERTVSK